MSSPTRHKIDATLQAMEKAHRASADEQLSNFAQSIHRANQSFERFAVADETNTSVQETAGHSLLALVEAEKKSHTHVDRSLEEVKNSLADMERKRMLALGAMTRLSEEDALREIKQVKEHILSLSLRVPLRADFIVHGHNIGLSIFRLFEAAQKAEGEVEALIKAKEALDKP
jgi:hypothetical protein